MPAGNVSVADRYQRLKKIGELLEDGKTHNQIAEELGMGLATVKRNIRYLDEIAVSDLTSEDLAKRRMEIYLELTEAVDSAKELFYEYKQDPSKTPKDIRYMFMSWLDALRQKAELFGFRNLKMEINTQINSVNQYTPPDTISVAAGDRLARVIKDSHERKVRGE